MPAERRALALPSEMRGRHTGVLGSGCNDAVRLVRIPSSRLATSAAAGTLALLVLLPRDGEAQTEPDDDTVHLAPVVVTATRTEALPFDVPASIDRIGGDIDPRRPAAGQHLREPGRRAGPARARPPELRAGRADLGARLRRALDLRHPRRAPLRRRHPRHACPTARARSRTSTSARPSASRCCAARSRRSTATRRAASSRSSPKKAAARRRVSRERGRRQLRHRRASAPRRAARPARSATSSAAATFTPTATATTAPPSATSATPSSPGGPTTPSKWTLVANSVALAEGAGPARPRRGRSSRPIRAASIRRPSPFDTRKTVDQTQLGVVYERRARRRRTRCARWSTAAIATPSSSRRSRSRRRRNPLHPGRRHRARPRLPRHRPALDARRRAWPTRRSRCVAGVAYDALAEHRRGFQNFVGTTLGVEGALRRDEDNDVWQLRRVRAGLAGSSRERWTMHAGVRHSSVRFSSRGSLRRRRQPRRQRPAALRRDAAGGRRAVRGEPRRASLRDGRARLRDADAERARLPAERRDRPQPRPAARPRATATRPA